MTENTTTVNGLMVGADWYSGPIWLDQASGDRRPWSGVYLVASVEPIGTRCLDVGKSTDIGERLRDHDRRSCWETNALGPIVVYTHLESTDTLRGFKEWSARQALQPVCGVR